MSKPTLLQKLRDPGALVVDVKDSIKMCSDAAAKIESDAKVIAALREALRDCPCPRPINTDPDDTTIGQCMDRAHCGCCYGTVLAATDEQTVGESK